MDKVDTIAAISTPPGVGGIAVVRVSGPLAHTILTEVLVDGKRRKREQYRPRQVYHGWVVDREGAPIDEVLAFYLMGPRSYTGEDMAEIQGHGGTAVAERVLSRVLEAGARLAEPGEFSQRAFLNGRMDLSQAEDVMSLIAARTAAAARIASRHMGGRWSRQVAGLYDTLLDRLTQVEAAVDFSEEGLITLDREALGQEITDICGQIREWLSDADAGRLLMEGMRAAILGRPNVGKSSLLNRLCQEERAIVTESPGTTRDVLEAEVSVKGLLIRLLDTAGIREAGDEAERIGVSRALSWIDKADRILYVLDATVPLEPKEKKLIKNLPAERTILIINKCDLPAALAEDSVREVFTGPILHVSARTGEGLEQLLSQLYESALGDKGTEHEATVIRTRHAEALRGTLRELKSAMDALAQGREEELIATDIREAAQYLGQITGQSVTEDMVARIFAQFCVGK